jgi:CelD/BcsL family acetyltransferase involved in cellulose biosynthesis
MRLTNFALATSGDDARITLPLPSPKLSRTLKNGVELAVYDDLAAVRVLWQGFQCDADCTAFQTFEWLSAWQRNIGSRGGVVPAIVIARDARNKILFIAPLAKHRSGFARELVWLGSGVCDYNAPLLAPDFSARINLGEFAEIWSAAMQLIQSNRQTRVDVVRLEKMPESIRAQTSPMLELPTSLNPSGSYATPVAQSWEAFYAAKRSPSTRRRDRTKRNRLAEAGEIKLVTAQTTNEALRALAILVKQKSAYFARLGIQNLFAQPGYLDFLRDFVSNPEASRYSHISELRVGSQVAATNFALIFGGRYYYTLSAYTDGELARLGPGAAHLHELLGYAIANKFAVFDFTIGDERYKLDWCDGAQPLYDYVAGLTARGKVIAVMLVAKARIKRMVKQTPVLWLFVTKGRAIKANLRSMIGIIPPLGEPSEK